jgi:hypothetical protein
MNLKKYVLDALEYGQIELCARFGEWSKEDKQALAKAAHSKDFRVADLDGDTNWLFQTIKNLQDYL